MSKDTILISEIFGPTIQGEGALIGQPTIFVRTGGCDYRCSWCDTLYAVESKYRHNWKPMSAEEIMAEIETLSGGKPIMVTISGGNPAIQDCTKLLQLGKARGYKFCIETQGSIAADWFCDLDILTLSPKPPSSGMDTKWEKFDACLSAAKGKPAIALKVVIFDDADYKYAQEASSRYPNLPIYLQPGNHSTDATIPADMDGLNARMRWLIDKATNDQWFGATILPQLHVQIWGNERGV